MEGSKALLRGQSFPSEGRAETLRVGVACMARTRRTVKGPSSVFSKSERRFQKTINEYS